MAEVVALLAERREEIRAITKLFRELCGSLGEDTAEHVLAEAISAEAESAGRRAAPSDPEVAGLRHFAIQLRDRDADGGMQTGRTELIEENLLEVEITRCDYHALYRSSSLSPSLSRALSCGREAAFARGYDHRLRLLSQDPPSGENRCCRLTFEWRPEAKATTKRPVVKFKVRDP